jgi:hypothetical protein
MPYSGHIFLVALHSTVALHMDIDACPTTASITHLEEGQETDCPKYGRSSQTYLASSLQEMGGSCPESPQKSVQ